MKEFIEAIKSGNLVDIKKHFISIMEERQEALKQELRVKLAEEIRVEGETDDEDEDDEDNDDSGDKKEKEKSEGDKPEDDKDE